MRAALTVFCICIWLFPVNSQAQGKDPLEDYLERVEEMKVSMLLQDGDGEILFRHNPYKKVPAASIIKVPILMVLFEQMESGRVSMEGKYTLRNVDKVGGSGKLQHAAAGSSYTYGFLAREMIQLSDNVATNILIAKLGMDNIGEMLHRNGLVDTQLNRYMMDFEAIKKGKQNYTSPYEINQLFLMLLSGDYLSDDSRGQMIEILTECADNSGIPRDLPAGVDVAHKTGTLDYIRGDAGIIFGDKTLVLSVFVENFKEQKEADEVIAKISGLCVSRFFEQESQPNDQDNP